MAYAFGGNIFDPESDNITSPELAVYRQIEQCQITDARFDVKLGSDGPNVLRPEWRLGAD